MQTPTEEPDIDKDQNALNDAVTKVLFEGVPMWKLCGWSAEQIDALYAIGYQLYQNDAFEEALKVFKPLLVLDSADSKVWMAAGACSQSLKDYENALESYSYAFAMDQANPNPVFHILECQVTLQQFDAARATVDHLLELTANKPEFQSIQQRTRLIAQTLASRIESNES